MRHLFLLLITLLSGSAVLDALPTQLQVFGPVKQVPPQCADPTFACQDLENARQCGVVKSCINDVWATMSAPEDNDDICSLCKEMVKEARDQLLSNMTQEELKEVFEGSCKLIPIKLIADGCIKLVDDFVPELVEMLVSRMDPNMVCTVAGLCNLAHLPIEKHMTNLLRLAALNVNTDQCDQCTTIVTEVKSFVTPMSEAEFTQMVEKICELEVTAPVCTPLVDTYASQIYQYIVSSDPKNVCAAIGVCSSPSNNVIRVPLENKNVNDDLVCQFCTNVLEHVKEMIIANTTMEEFKTALLNFCTHLGRFSNECTSLVNDYYDMIFDDVRKMDTKAVCTVIGLCQSGLYTNRISPLVKLFPPETLPKYPKMIRLTPSLPISTKANSQAMVKLVPAKVVSKKDFRKTAQIETNDIFGSTGQSQLPIERLGMPLMTLDRDLDCPLCRAVTFFLQKDLQGDRSRDAARTAVAGVCVKWVGEFPQDCNSLVSKYSERMVNHITEHNDFDSMCGLIKACPLEEKETGINIRVISPAPTLNDEVCDLCKLIFDDAEKFVNDTKFQKSVKEFLEQGCQICPAKQKCIDMIDQNIDKLLALIEKYLQSSVACPALHLCPASSKFHLSPSLKNVECDLCKDLVQQLVTMLQDPQTKSYIQSTLEKGCSLLPQQLSAQCKTLVDQNMDAIIQLLIGALNPDVICASLNICPDSQKLVKPPRKNDLECELCKEVIQKVEDQLKEEKTEESIKEALEKVCDYLPSSMLDKCKAFVDTYTETIITLLLKEINPEVICEELKICPETKKIKLPKSDLECDLCKQVVQIVENELKDKETKDAIRNALDKVCSLLPSSLSARCKTFIDSYAELLMSLLIRNLDPTMVCAALNVCPTQDVECEGCQYLFHYIQEQLASNDTQDQLKNVLKRFCDIFPQTYADNCDAFVDEYGSSLFMLIAQELDPSVMCPKLGMCPSTKKFVNKVVQQASIKSLTFDKCQICTTVVDYMDKLLEDDSVDQEITEVVEKVCTIIPASVKDKCSDIIETYGPYILQMIGQIADSKQVCQDIDFCSRPPGHVHLLGGHKCTFGPSYWCQSKGHAAACKAEMFCTQKVWKN